MKARETDSRKYYDTTIEADGADIDERSRTVNGKIEDADISVAYDNYSDVYIADK